MKVPGGADLSAFDCRRAVGGGLVINAVTGESKHIDLPGEMIGIVDDSIAVINGQQGGH